MVVVQETLISFLERAAEDPDLLAEVGADPLGAAYRAGVRLTATDFKEMMGLPEATDQELIEVLCRRLDRSSDSCGPCGL